jgi:hypothetical protein
VQPNPVQSTNAQRGERPFVLQAAEPALGRRLERRGNFANAS